jgi:FAD:protein FMN transferase
MSTLSRRRLLSIAACAALATSSRSEPLPRLRWHGVALGADVSITLDGPEEITRPALARARHEIEAHERRFSLFRLDSDLVRLNAQGSLPDLDARWRNLLTLCDQLHHATNGAFDPTIQPLWHAHAFGGDVEAARALVGWRRVALPTPMQRGLHLDAGQALSFNGIAQGAATDAVRDSLKASGLTRVMIDIGEVATLGGPWRIGLSDPTAGQFATLKLKDMALAVSSPAALRLDAGAYHILHPKGDLRPRWSSVAVAARSAAVADGLSTAGCFMRAAELERCARQLPQVHQVLVTHGQGNERAFSIPL